MPYPNSQTPVTLKLNELFSNRAAQLPNGLRDLGNRSDSMADLAQRYSVVTGPHGKNHVNRWPKSQQNLVRDTMILALEKNIPISFDWQTDSSTSAEIVHFGNRIGVTFRSPLNYPPYWGP